MKVKSIFSSNQKLGEFATFRYYVEKILRILFRQNTMISDGKSEVSEGLKNKE